MRAVEKLPGQLWRSKTNQLWRNLMLAAWFGKVGHRGSASVAVVALASDPGATTAYELLHEQLVDEHKSHLRLISLEDINKTTWEKAPELRWWAHWFRTRYLDWWMPRSHMARSTDWPQQHMPVFGRSLQDSVAVAQAVDWWPDEWVHPDDLLDS